MIVLAAILGVAIGVALGILGAGGSILAVPVLVHVAGLGVPAATATSLVAVGAAAATASLGHREHVEGRLAISFVVVGVVGSLLGSLLARHLSDGVVLAAFSLIVLLAAHRMLQPAARPGAGSRSLLGRIRTAGDGSPGTELAGLVGAGLLVGVLTGLFGVGGGFVIVPVLTLLLAREMRGAVATSLVVIAGNAVVALLARGLGSVDWRAAVIFTVPMLLGSVFGSRIAQGVDGDKLRRAFAWLLVAVALANLVSVIV